MDAGGGVAIFGYALATVLAAVAGWALASRARAVVRLRSAHGRLERFVQEVPGVVYVKDAQGRYVYASPTFQRYFGKGPDQIVGRTDHDL